MTIASKETPSAKVGLLLHNATFYDLTVWLMTLGRERSLRQKIVDLAELKAGDVLLDVGCGTGSLAIAARQRIGTAGRVCGVDASPEMLARAKRKAAKAGADVEFRLAAVQSLPLPDGQFDCATATVMLHHLSRINRRNCAAEVYRVLKPGGRFLVVEFGSSSNQHGPLRHFHRHGHVNVEEIQQVLVDAGFEIREQGDVGIGNLHFALASKGPFAG
jgi:ubiquinone/menaquinone biosynthesis C-methylase UbiE